MSFCLFPVIDTFLTNLVVADLRGSNQLWWGDGTGSPSKWWSHWSVQKMSRCGPFQYGLVGTMVFSWWSWRSFASLVPPWSYHSVLGPCDRTYLWDLPAGEWYPQKIVLSWTALDCPVLNWVVIRNLQKNMQRRVCLICFKMTAACTQEMNGVIH